jgi:uncharacterized lipoprotein YajG
MVRIMIAMVLLIAWTTTAQVILPAIVMMMACARAVKTVETAPMIAYWSQEEVVIMVFVNQTSGKTALLVPMIVQESRRANLRSNSAAVMVKVTIR